MLHPPLSIRSAILHKVTHLWLCPGLQLLQLLRCCLNGSRGPEELSLCDHCWILRVHPL